MKKLILAVLAVALVACTPKKEQPEESFVLKRGTNLSHWLSQSTVRGEERAKHIEEDDIARLAELGFDHVRIPIDEEQFWDEEGNKLQEAWDLLTNALDLCMKHHIRAIVDLHIIRSHYFNADFEGGKNTLFTDPAEQEKLCDMWRQLSAVLKGYPVSMVAYEFMNEPVADEHDQWNDLIAKVHKALRELEPERVMVIGSNMWQGHYTFKYLRVPENDKNIYLAFHYYNPMILTHNKAWWTEWKDYEGTYEYPSVMISDEELAKFSAEDQEKYSIYNEMWDREKLKSQIMDCVEVSQKLGLPLVCTEWGCYEFAEREPVYAWTRDMISIFDEYNIAWTTWCYDADFGFWMPDDSGYKDKELVDILMSGKALGE